MHSQLKTRSAAIAGIVTTTLAAATVGVSPAGATSAALAYACSSSSPSGQTFTVTNDSNAPRAMYVGQSAPIKLTSTIEFSSEYSQTLYGYGSAADGSIHTTTTIAGVSRRTILTVPKTPVTGAVVTVVGTGSAGTFTAARTGTVTLAMGAFVSTMHVYDGLGVDQTPTGDVVTCDPPTGASTTFDTITVKKDTTKTAVAPTSKTKKVTATVDVTTTHGSTAAGKVTVLVQKGKKVLETQRATLRKGQATVKLPKRLKKGVYTVTAKYAGNGNLIGSSSKHTVRVR